jgi:glycosyltransferase involved in cell wall biosynthesis
MPQNLLRSFDAPDAAPASPFRVPARSALALAPSRVARPHLMQVVLSLAPGGTERLVIEISRRIAATFDVTVCCLDDEGAWAPEMRRAGIDVIALGRESGFRPGIGRQIAQLARERGVALLHCHQYSPFVYGRIAKALHPQLGLIYTEHGRLSDAPPSWKRQLINPLLSQFDGAIVAVSDDLRQYMNLSRFPRSRVAVVRNGIDPAPLPGAAERRLARERLGIADDVFVIASVARLDPVKDFPSMLDAYATARQSLPPSRLLLIGDGPERAALEARAARPDLAGAVEFLGMRDDARALLSAADLYANSSISEGVSITILEAMAAGIPIVATSAGGTPEVLADGLAGVLVPSRNPARMAQAMIALAKDPAMRKRLAHLGRQRVETSFTVQRMVAEYVQLYHRFLD